MADRCISNGFVFPSCHICSSSFDCDCFRHTSVVFSHFRLIPNLIFQYIAVVVFSIMRPILYSAINNFCTKFFGFRHFGKIYGIIVLIAGIVNTLQYLLSYIAVSVLDSFLVVNLLLEMVVLSLLLIPFLLRNEI